MSKIIDGNVLAKKHEEILKEKLESIKKVRAPIVISFCNQDDPPSVKYTFMKLAKASDLGIDFVAEEFSANTPREYLEKMVNKYSKDSEIDGILVQLPLPENLNPFREGLLNLIPLEKDIDGLRDESPYLPATVKAVISILDENVKEWKSEKIAVVGATGEVGKPMVKYLKENNVTVSEISRNLGNLDTDLKDADIIVSAVGEENLIKEEMIKNGVILIDVGLGDFDSGCYERASMYTPKTGGVGPMTVISLMENVVESYASKFS